MISSRTNLALVDCISRVVEEGKQNDSTDQLDLVLSLSLSS